LLLLLVLVGLLLLPACFTSMLWGSDLDDTSLTTDATYSRGDDFPLWAKIIFTPLAVVLDILTSPIQELFADEDEEADEDDGQPCR